MSLANTTISSSWWKKSRARAAKRRINDEGAHPPFPLPSAPQPAHNAAVNNAHFDLRGRARRAMTEAGFQPDFPAEVRREIQGWQNAPAAPSSPDVQDLRLLPWSSIDNDESRDLDQVEFVERLPDGSLRLLVGIADVDACVTKASATNGFAAGNTTSVYTGAATFPMLPAELSTDLTSLVADKDRLALV